MQSDVMVISNAEEHACSWIALSAERAMSFSPKKPTVYWCLKMMTAVAIDRVFGTVDTYSENRCGE